MPRPLDGDGEHALMTRAGSRSTAGDNFTLLGGEAEQALVILIINEQFFFFAKTTDATLSQHCGTPNLDSL